MFHLKEKSHENLDLALFNFDGFGRKIETLRMIEVGVEFNKPARDHEIVLTKQFDYETGLGAFVSYPKHLPVIDTMRTFFVPSLS